MFTKKLLFSLIFLILCIIPATAQVDFHPMDIEIQAESGEILEVGITITNEGEELFEWTIPSHPLRGENYEPWELIRSYDFGETVDDPSLYGVAFVENQFFVAGSNDGDPQIYVFSIEGELIRQFSQPIEHRHGMKDLTWDGELLWGSIDRKVYGFSTWGEVEQEWEAPYYPTTAITYDSERNIFWLGATTNDPVAMDREGDIIDGMELDRLGMRIYGLAYWESSTDDNKLLVHHKDRETNQQMVMGLNPITGDTTGISTLLPEAGGVPQGVFVTEQYDSNSWVIMTMVNNANRDRVDVWQIRNNWYYIYDIEGSIESNTEQEIILNVGYESLEQRVYESELTFLHNFLMELPLSH